MVIAFDSGAHTGWAVLDRSRILACGLWRIDCPAPLLPWKGARIVIEKPRERRHGKVRSTVNDLITLAWRGGIVEGFARAYEAASVETVLPEQWKGQLPKNVTIERIRQCAQIELTARHDVWDAIGIGLWVQGFNPCSV